MRSYEVSLYTDGLGECWVEIIKDGVQEGSDIDCLTRRKGLAVAMRECKRIGLASFSEHRVHRIAATVSK